jgi:hypothetical protein
MYGLFIQNNYNLLCIHPIITSKRKPNSVHANEDLALMMQDNGCSITQQEKCMSYTTSANRALDAERGCS